jgi:hypothetical protein
MRLAALLVIVGIILSSVAVGLYDYRAGVGIFGLSCAAVGLWNLTRKEL